MQNIETVMTSFEGRMKEKGVTREMESVNRMVSSLQRDMDKIKEAQSQKEPQLCS